MTEERLFTDITSNRYYSAEITQNSCMMDYFDKCIVGTAENAPRKTFKAELGKQNYVMGAVRILFRVRRELSKKF